MSIDTVVSTYYYRYDLRGGGKAWFLKTLCKRWRRRWRSDFELTDMEMDDHVQEFHLLCSA